MIIAISTELDKIFSHFGRAPQFTFFTINENNDVLEKKVISSPGHSMGSIPSFIQEQGADVMITGGMGKKAIQIFNKYNIDVIMGVSGNVNDVLKEFLKGTLKTGKFSPYEPGEGQGFGITKIDNDN